MLYAVYYADPGRVTQSRVSLANHERVARTIQHVCETKAAVVIKESITPAPGVAAVRRQSRRGRFDGIAPMDADVV